MSFTRFFRILWILFFVLLIFLDRENILVKIGLIIYVLILGSITCGRILESRNEWRKIVKEDIE